MPAQKPIIMYDAPEAASLKTVTGWVSADGRFFGSNEDLARYSGATHRRCEVSPEHKIYEVNSYCKECHQARRKAQGEVFGDADQRVVRGAAGVLRRRPVLLR